MSTYRTYAFRRLKGEITRLSRLKWAFSFSHGYLVQQLEKKGADKSTPITEAVTVLGFDESRLQATVGEFIQQSASIEDGMNLMLLVKACAGLEDYIGRFAVIWANAKGYSDADRPLLNRIGEALIKPATVSNLESSLSYLELLLNVKFGINMSKLGQAYKLRCIAAHNAAVVDYESVKYLPELASDLGKPIRLSWDRLHDYLKAIGDTCEIIEASLTEKERQRVEIKIIVFELLRSKELEPKNEAKVRKVLLEQFAFQNLPDRAHLSEMISLFQK